MASCLFLLTSWAIAQGSLSVSGAEVKLRDKDGNAIVVGKEIGPNAEMSGVAVINGEVFIDGDKVPTGTKTYRGKKSGKTYGIEWGKNGNVSVSEK